MPSASRTNSRRRMPRAEREDEMLEAAGQAFATHGFHDASMDAIAEAAGISKPMLYNYFGSKQGLYVAYVERSGRALMKSMREADSRSAPAAQRLHAGILAFLTYAEEHRSGWTILHRETPRAGRPASGRTLRAARTRRRHADDAVRRRGVRPRVRRSGRVSRQLVAGASRAIERSRSRTS